jgi:hypothetical protein
MNHVVVEGTLLLNSEDVLLLLMQTLALLIFWQVGAPMYEDVILLACPAEVTHRSVHDDVRKKHLPRLLETGVTYDSKLDFEKMLCKHCTVIFDNFDFVSPKLAMHICHLYIYLVHFITFLEKLHNISRMNFVIKQNR